MQLRREVQRRRDERRGKGKVENEKKQKWLKMTSAWLYKGGAKLTSRNCH